MKNEICDLKMIREITSVFVAVALAFAVSSCSKADDVLPDNYEKVMVKYRVALDDATVQTRAEGDPDGTAEYGKGAEIDSVLCMVFSLRNGVPVLFSKDTVKYSGTPVEFNPEFFRNQDYKIVFIAYDTDAYSVSNETVMTYKNEILAPEKYDAFTHAGDVKFNETDAEVTLSRPFALWKFYTADEDVKASASLGLPMKAASVSATVSTSYNVLNDTFGSPVNMVFKRTFPADDSQTFKDAADNVVRYTLLSAQYIMPSDNIDAELKIFDDADNCVAQRTITSIPTVANTKVNVYGRLATSEKTFTVTLDLGDGTAVNKPIQ